MKKILASLGIMAGAVILFYALNSFIYQEKQSEGLPANFKSVIFSISGEPVTLVNGVATLPLAPGSASERTIHYFGNELAHDIDADGDLDIVFLVTDDSGGSGTFFYMVGAINTGDGYQGTQAMYLGDRIAPQTTQPGPGSQVIVNFADRVPGESMTTPPSIGKSMYILYSSSTNDFGEVVQDFEGESAGTANLIRVTSPVAGGLVTNPVVVSGEARGYWFFEASFPIIVTDWDGRIIGEGYATADGDWMTEDLVPFTGSIEFDLPTDVPYKRGTIIFKKDNPSGLPEHDDAVEIPVQFE